MNGPQIITRTPLIFSTPRSILLCYSVAISSSRTSLIRVHPSRVKHLKLRWTTSRSMCVFGAPRRMPCGLYGEWSKHGRPWRAMAKSNLIILPTLVAGSTPSAKRFAHWAFSVVFAGANQVYFLLCFYGRCLTLVPMKSMHIFFVYLTLLHHTRTFFAHVSIPGFKAQFISKS